MRPQNTPIRCVRRTRRFDSSGKTPRSNPPPQVARVRKSPARPVPGRPGQRAGPGCDQVAFGAALPDGGDGRGGGGGRGAGQGRDGGGGWGGGVRIWGRRRHVADADQHVPLQDAGLSTTPAGQGKPNNPAPTLPRTTKAAGP